MCAWCWVGGMQYVSLPGIQRHATLKWSPQWTVRWRGRSYSAEITDRARGLRSTTTQHSSAELLPINRWSCTITEKAPTRAFSWLKTATTAFTFKTLLKHYAKRALTPQSLNVKLGRRHNYHKGRAAIRHYANQTACPLWPLRHGPNFTLRDCGVNACSA